MTRTRLITASRAVAGVVAAILVAAAPASAGGKTVADADDSSGALDIATVSHGHHDRLLVHRLTTYEDWDTSLLADGLTDIRFNFFLGDGEYRYVLVDVSADGTPYGELRDFDTQRTLGFVKVWRPDARSLRIELPKRMLGRRVTTYRWSATTTFHQADHETCGSDPETHTVVGCADSAPTRGFIRHRLS